ncbi:Small-subunit processome Utp11 [Penicillium riverlandense]|uniref:Small-subunit processome Utp11 n=1 Tax=Penicillium riverlandense TaxID=1903569 RepID=UPI0025477237|nr:Small-subunit processome Utp11 [Penicillium riverlandense]KAJ5819311.1 Small-subunit processome Utp11 [Penicillium riverlandense]
MSSMRNAVQRRQHRERGQLSGREKWGILEKHKDYSLRAKDYNAKKSKIKRLEEKARDRNPDEFAFGMMGDRNHVQGRHGQGKGVGRDSAAARGLSHDAIKLLKTQDKGYLRTVGERVRREMERVERDVQLQGGMSEVLDGKGQHDEESEEDEFDGLDDEIDFGSAPKKPRKTVFADDRQQQQALKKHRLQDDRTDEEDDKEQTTSRKTPKQLEKERQALVEARRARKLRKRAAETRESKLAALRKQYAEIQAAEQELDWQRARMDNSVGGTNKHGIKWKIRERKR